jgi:PiT family inorganic phosphate transporter
MAKRWGPVYVFLVGFIISLVTMFKGLKHLNLELSVSMSFVIAVVFGLLIAIFGWWLIQKVEVDPDADKEFHFASVEKVFVPMMIFTACQMALVRWRRFMGWLNPVVSLLRNRKCQFGF